MENTAKAKKLSFNKIYLLLILLELAMCVVFSINPAVWADEGYSLELAKRSFSDIWRITALDVHPPLYYFWLKLFTMPFGYNLFISKLITALPCVLLTAFGGYQLKKLFNERVSVFFMLCYMAFPFIMLYTTELRQYSIAELFVFANAVYAYRCFKGGNFKDWALFILAGVAAAYTHYFALVSVCIIYGIFFLAACSRKKKCIKWWLLAVAATVILYVPWLKNFISQLVFKVNNEYWIDSIDRGDIVSYLKTIFYTPGMKGFFLFSSFAYLFMLIRLLASKNKQDITLCLLSLAVPAGTIIAGVGISILIRPIFVIRYALPASPLMVFFFAYTLANTKSKAMVASLMTLVLLGGASTFADMSLASFSPDKKLISSKYIAMLPERDAYYIPHEDDNLVSMVLPCYDSETPIYSQLYYGDAGPYRNLVKIEEFIPEENPNLVMILHEGIAVPEEYHEQYDIEHLGTMIISREAREIYRMVLKNSAAE